MLLAPGFILGHVSLAVVLLIGLLARAAYGG